MKSLFVSFFILIILIGCSNSDVKPTSSENLSLEQQITSIMADNKLEEKEIIDYDIKGNFIYVIFKNNHINSNNHNPDLVILKNKNKILEWVAGPDDVTLSLLDQEVNGMIFGRNDGPSVTLLLSVKQPQNSNVKGVKVLGEMVKAVTYIEEYTEDFSMQYMYWIAYTEENPTAEDIEIILK
ncbi:hypothetical protein FS935_01155 [Metabacillus litoralis]|uniref:Lipoprotein n=1 Tax=Metabacillus litoralis TaxID=152268 RepID=A0A5C6W4H7_9BACI|nr:hypothetical protein [Metabacillus litoralis]TXC92836.1 hypothetical protein FS935_01155 [Metabacillus litoralis]